MKRIAACLFLASLASIAAAAPRPGAMPADPKSLTKTISYADMESFLRSVDGKGIVSVSVEGKSAQGRSLYLVHLSRSVQPAWTILFYAQQHGDEISGKDALLFLIREIAEDPARLPKDVDVWIMPMMNPDGAVAGARVNGAGADINRDHLTLEQPETRALHGVVRRVRPHLAVDCHEFARDTESYAKRGWTKWADITMDSLNNPMFDPEVRAAADRWVDSSQAPLAEAGHNFLRYFLGGAPPDDEQRHSAPDVDSGMNSIGTYGGLSFIIEAAARKEPAQLEKELGKRVDAYLVLLRRFVKGDENRASDLASIAASRMRPVPPFIPTNYIWVNPRAEVTRFPVVELATGKTLEIPTANMMTDVAVKRSVPAPLGYAIPPRAAAELGALLDRQGIPYETLAAPRAIEAETCTLLRVEDDFDELYKRYEGRQIVRRNDAAKMELPEGALWVPLAGESAVRAALLLEPASLYGLYQYPRYRALVGADGVLPVLRVVR